MRMVVLGCTILVRNASRFCFVPASLNMAWLQALDNAGGEEHTVKLLDGDFIYIYIYIILHIYIYIIYDNSKMTWDTFQRDFTSTEIRWVFAHLQFFCHDPSHGAETAALLLALPVARQLGEAAVGQLSTGAMANLLNSCRVVGINQQNMVLKWVYIYILVGGLEHLDYFSIYMGIIIFPFDFHIFQDG